MRRNRWLDWTGLLAIAAVLGLGACGGSSSNSPASSGGRGHASPVARASGAITIVAASPPDSLDPQAGDTIQAAEADWLAYTGLTTYAHKSGTPGAQLAPGLSTALPTVSQDGKTYTATLRKGLVFSNGVPVRASDFTYSIERAIKLRWGGEGQFIEGNIVGAKQFAKGASTTISGITADDKTGRITIHLLAPNGAFGHVLAFPALGLMPTGSPLRNQPINPPPGAGPYVISNVVPHVSFSLVKNLYWAALNIPGIPVAGANINVKISSNLSGNALSVLGNQADVFDSADKIPAGLLTQIQLRASGRYAEKITNSARYFSPPREATPFSSRLSRAAGYRTSSAFTSTRIDLSSAVFHPLYGWDWSTLKLK